MSALLNYFTNNKQEAKLSLG